MTEPQRPAERRASGRFWQVFLKFAASSFTASLIDLGLFYLGCEMLRDSGLVWYATLCTVVARVASAAYNYLINYRLVFKSHANHRRAAALFLLMTVVKMAASAMLVTGILLLAGSGVPELLVKIPVDVGLFFLSYLFQKAKVY